MTFLPLFPASIYWLMARQQTKLNMLKGIHRSIRTTLVSSKVITGRLRFPVLLLLINDFNTLIMSIRLLSSILILFAVYMGLKQGYAMLCLKPSLLDMFSKWNFSQTALQLIGAVTLLSALLILFPKTFVWGNFLMAAGILMIICFQLTHKDLKSAAIELPFFLMNLLLIYLQHPLTKN